MAALLRSLLPPSGYALKNINNKINMNDKNISGQETWAVRTSGTGNFSVRTRKNVIAVVRMND